jgi:Zn ribbon nucleic-acid-binding protein
VVSCVDDLRATYSKPSLWLWVGCAAAFLFFPLVAIVLFPLLLLALVIRHQLKYERVLASLVCPHCEKPAGKTFRKQGVLHLGCQHCGKETLTDAREVYRSPPLKA